MEALKGFDRTIGNIDSNQQEREAMTKGAIITVEWGYEIHQLVLTPKNWTRVKSGHALTIRGKGYYYDAQFYWDHWNFGGGLDGALSVEYDRPGSFDPGDGFIGNLSDAMIEEIDYLPASRKGCLDASK